jgi:hypothetical protein
MLHYYNSLGLNIPTIFLSFQSQSQFSDDLVNNIFILGLN